jgi:hypothetical protein
MDKKTENVNEKLLNEILGRMQWFDDKIADPHADIDLRFIARLLHDLMLVVILVSPNLNIVLKPEERSDFVPERAE